VETNCLTPVDGYLVTCSFLPRRSLLPSAAAGLSNFPMHEQRE
jgi:hypothetical protein